LEFEAREIAKTNEFSLTEIKLNGIGKAVRNRDCEAVYYIVKGSGRFTFLDIGEEISVDPGDIVVIPRGEAYRDDGKMTMISLYRPPFDKSQVEYLDQ
jgi:mannose-6-phosphate isomerase-like protein (cupin superfamily)